MSSCKKCGQPLYVMGTYTNRRGQQVQSWRCRACGWQTTRVPEAMRKPRKPRTQIKNSPIRKTLAAATVQRKAWRAARNRALLEQGGVCQACGVHLPADRAVLDHDHSCCDGERLSSGTAGDWCGQCGRAALCSHCNMALGNAADNPALLRRLAQYVEDPTSDPPATPLRSEAAPRHGTTADTVAADERTGFLW